MAVRANITQILLAHYDAHARALPWRADTDPYRVWISEVMLQQTRVETVVPYYRRWLERFPTVDALADAAEEEVLKAWEGLGYYSRARNLRRAALLVRERHAGVLPRDAQQLSELPGFGDYTVGAVASIAYGAALPAVDGNVKRVLSRVYDLAAPSPAHLRSLAAALVPADRPGDFNQALMEFGATVCTPRAPRCEMCPLESACGARRAGTVLERPARAAPRTIPAERVAVVVLRDQEERVLMVRRPARGLLAGMWSLPEAPLAKRRSAQAAAAALARLYARVPARPVMLREIKHTFTHRRVTYVPFLFNVIDGSGAAPKDCAWLSAADTLEKPVPVAMRKVLGLDGAQLSNGGFGGERRGARM